MAESNNLGAGNCPIKGCSGTASYTLSKKGLPVATCMVCKAQIFSRGEVSDELLRDLIDAKPKAQTLADAIRATGATTSSRIHEDKPPAPKPPPPPPKPEPKRPSWGMLAS